MSVVREPRLGQGVELVEEEEEEVSPSPSS